MHVLINGNWGWLWVRNLSAELTARARRLKLDPCARKKWSFSSKGMGTGMVVAGVAATARGEMVVNPAPGKPVGGDTSDIRSFSGGIECEFARDENQQNQFKLNFSAINDVNTNFLGLSGYEGKSEPPVHFFCLGILWAPFC